MLESIPSNSAAENGSVELSEVFLAEQSGPSERAKLPKVSFPDSLPAPRQPDQRLGWAKSAAGRCTIQLQLPVAPTSSPSSEESLPPHWVNMHGVQPDRLQVLDRISSRGFTVQAILEFLCLLISPQRALEEIEGLSEALDSFAGIPRLGPMPDLSFFNPDSCTTFDVAYKAVVPLTRHARSAYAHIMMRSQRVYPKCIITHTWGNLFIHTVAACVADALGKPYYFGIAPRLKSFDRIQGLICDLQDRGVAEKTYWLCLISINQHKLGCERFAQCECGCPKLTDDKEPECETGHFRDVLRYLKQKDNDFYQLIAFDKMAAVLKRLWVVAEVAEVNINKSKQAIMPHFPLSLTGASLKEMIEDIDIQQCEVTMQEDKDTILSTIKSTADYNTRARQSLSRPFRDIKKRDRLCCGGPALLVTVFLCLCATVPSANLVTGTRARVGNVTSGLGLVLLACSLFSCSMVMALAPAFAGTKVIEDELREARRLGLLDEVKEEIAEYYTDAYSSAQRALLRAVLYSSLCLSFVIEVFLLVLSLHFLTEENRWLGVALLFVTIAGAVACCHFFRGRFSIEYLSA